MKYSQIILVIDIMIRWFERKKKNQNLESVTSCRNESLPPQKKST